MRRGLVNWSQEELPVEILDARVARLQDAMRAAQLDIVLAYTSFAQPAPVQWLCNFLPYWGDALLAVLPDQPPLLLASLTRRVHPWIHSVCHTGGVVTAPNLGKNVVALLDEKIPAGRKIGVIGFDSLPWSVAEPLIKAGRGEALVDVSDMYAALRQPADSAEIKLSAHAMRIAGDALMAIPAAARRTSEVIAAIESSARLAAAEEVLLRIAPDLGRAASLLRMEGDAPLGARYAVELSLAYKGVWVRMTRCVAADLPNSWERAQRWFAGATAGLGEASAKQLAAGAPGKVIGWTLEASIGIHPLQVVASSDTPQTVALNAGSLAVLSVELELEDGPWRASSPLLIGGQDSRGTQ